MPTYTFRATSTSATGVNTLDNSGEFDTIEQAQAFMDEWVSALNSAGYNSSGTWAAAFVNQQ
jgi:hypothetical protein